MIRHPLEIKTIKRNEKESYREIIFRYKEFCASIRNISFIFFGIIAAFISIINYGALVSITLIHYLLPIIIYIIFVISIGYILDYVLLLFWDKSLNIDTTYYYYILSKYISIIFVLFNIIFIATILFFSFNILNISFKSLSEARANTNIIDFVESYYEHNKQFPNNIPDIYIYNCIDKKLHIEYINHNQYFEIKGPLFISKYIYSNNQIINISRNNVE